MNNRSFAFVCAVTLAACLLGMIQPASAAGFGIQPIRQVLTPEAPVGQFTITSAEDAPVQFQVFEKRWVQVGGKDVLEDTRDLLVVPPIFTVFPFGPQLFRVGLRGSVKMGPVEQTYRVLVREVPSKVNLKGPTIQIARQFSMPIFVPPLKTNPQMPVFTIVQHGNKSTLKVVNSGNVHALIGKATLVADGKTLTVGNFGYVLAGQTRTMTLQSFPVLHGSGTIQYFDEGGAEKAPVSIMP